MRARARRQSGFTLVEMIVVIVLIGVIVSVIAPRFPGAARRRADDTARAAALLLSAAAYRDTVGSERLALEFDGSRRTLELLVPRAEAAGSGTSAGVTWRADPLAQRVTMPDGVRLTARADGRELDARGWRVVFAPTEPRPAVRLLLVADDDRRSEWVIDLPPLGAAARLEVPGRPAKRREQPIDLDEAGRGGHSW